jgi:diaminohydroxyphosphoribosylaminopyrimidine deaminase/5-amino-6-(5-phosphoribosylamino)uracil reductase
MTQQERQPTRDEIATRENHMHRALAIAENARTVSPPNPWVGCVVVTTSGQTFEGATEAPGGRHAEIVALDAARTAGANLAGATVYTTLEPCNHTGRTGPCTEALITAGVAHVVTAVADPDSLVSGQGFARLRSAGVSVDVGCLADEAERQLAAYLHHRRTGRPFVVLKIAMTLDGRIAAADGSSQWITGESARSETHRLRSHSGAVIVGAGTVRADDPSLTTRLVPGPSPRRVVLGSAPSGAKVHPCLEWSGSLEDLLDRLGNDEVVQVLVEGGARVAASFHRAHLVDRYVFHIAPAVMGGDRAKPMFEGLDGQSMADLWRGHLVHARPLGGDVEIVVEPNHMIKEPV